MTERHQDRLREAITEELADRWTSTLEAFLDIYRSVRLDRCRDVQAAAERFGRLAKLLRETEDEAGELGVVLPLDKHLTFEARAACQAILAPAKAGLWSLMDELTAGFTP